METTNRLVPAELLAYRVEEYFLDLPGWIPGVCCRCLEPVWIPPLNNGILALHVCATCISSTWT